MYDIVVIGGGPAGITAAIYGVRAGKKVLVLEANKVGGKILGAHVVDNYPGLFHVTGEELGKKFLEQAEALDIEIKYEKAMNITEMSDKKIVQTLENSYETKTIIIATGNDKRELGVPGEKELVGRGVSYCATCDGNFFKNKKVAIVGGGEESIDDALYLAGICEKVYFIYNTKMDVSRLDKDNIEIIADTKVLSINGEKVVENISFETKDGKDGKFDVSGVFVAIANVPETSYLLKGLDVSETGNVISDDLTTSKDGIFVAGDLRVKSLRQVATAVSDGAIAATEAVRYLNNLKNGNSFEIKIYKKNIVSELTITVNNDSISYQREDKSMNGTDEVITTGKIIEDKDIIDKLVSDIYKPNIAKIREVYEKVNKLNRVSRSKNTATNNLTIKEDGKKMNIDCYVQEYDNIPSLFTVEIEKFINENL